MKRALTIIFFLVILFLFISPYALLNFNTAEDGIWFKPAIDFARGKVLFRDTMSPYGIFTVLLQGFTIKLFGEYLVALRLQAAFMYALTAVIMFFVWRKYLSLALSVASVLLWLVLAPFYEYMLHPWSSIYALVSQALTFLILIRFIERKTNIYLFLAGMTAMLTVLIRQPVGVFLTLGCAVFLLFYGLAKKLSFRKILIMYAVSGAGAVISFIPFFLYLFFNGAVSAWWLQSFVYAKEYAIIIRGVSVEQLIKGLFLGRYFRLGYYHLMFIWLAIPLSTFYLFFKTIVPLIRRKALTDSQLKLFLAAVLSIMSWMQYYPMTDPVHCFWAASPIMGFFVYVLINVFVPKDKKLSVLFMRLFITLLVFTLILRVELSLSRFKNTANYSRTFPFLKYIRLTAFDDITLSSFHSKLVSQMGEKDTYITIADDFSVSLMDPRFHQIDPLHGIWGFFTEKLHPEYYPKVNSYISQEHPVIVTRTLPFVSNYCSVKGVNYTHLFMGIHIPSSRIFDAQLSENEITLYPKKDTVITGISGLKTPIHHFSIFDLKKIDMSPLQDEEISFPVTLYKDTALTIPLKNPAPHIVIHFKDPDIETCTVPVNNKGFYP